MSKPSISILPALPSDIHALSALENLVFYDEEFSTVAFGPTRDSPENIQLRADSLLKSQKESDEGTGKKVRYVKAVDLESGKIVGFAGWHFVQRDGKEIAQSEPVEEEEHDETKGSGEGEDGKDENGWGIGANAKFCVDAFCVADEHMDRSVNYGSYAKLSTIVIHPTHQRRGIGSMLLEEGLKEVDQLGLPCVLGASPEGEGLYRRYGWEEVEAMEMRLWEYEGGEGMGLARHVVMCRPAKGNV